MVRHPTGAPPLRAVLLDVGGTLWPDGFPPIEDRYSLVTARLREALPHLSPSLASSLVKEMESSVSPYGAPAVSRSGAETLDLEADPGLGPGTWSAAVPWSATEALEQDSDARVREAAGRCGLTLSSEGAIMARRALCIPVLGRIEMFAGAADLLRAIKAQGARSVVVSNTITRDRVLYRNDFEGFGVSQYIDVVLTSIDVGFRKPHPTIFATAVDAARCTPMECLMVGNSEENDIIPAKRLGMRAVRVCLEEPPPATSAADAVVTSLQEVEDLFRAWSA